MSEFKGTPGPWSFNHSTASDEVTFCINVFANGVSQICYLQSHEEYLPSRVHTVANANLIAAAPELLDALQWMKMALNSGTAMDIEIGKEKSDAAISKALGQ